MAKDDEYCPVCHQRLVQRKPCEIMINSRKDNIGYRPYKLNALYCDRCDLPFVNEMTWRSVCKDSGAFVDVFLVKTSTAQAVRQQMSTKQSKQHHRNSKKHQIKRHFEVVENHTIHWKTTQQIRSTPKELQNCPHCHSPLVPDNTLVPISKFEKLKVNGVCCRKCNQLFISKLDAQKLSREIRDNRYSKGFTIDGKELWNASEREREERWKKEKIERERKQRERLTAVSGSVVMICVSDGKVTTEYTVTGATTLKIEGNIVTYASETGRELLSAAFAPERKKQGSIKGRNFTVTKVRYREEDNLITHRILPKNITIDEDGGYSSSVKNRFSEIVDLLLYSSLTQRYEIMRATYDKTLQYCYTDVGIFRRFVHQYGNPGLPIFFGDKSTSRRTALDKLHEESFLKKFGYNVSEADHLSDNERREILKDIVDMEIKTVHQVAHMLDFLYNLHSSEKDSLARLKWESDKKFIENYKVNPSRFLISMSSSSHQQNYPQRQAHE